MNGRSFIIIGVAGWLGLGMAWAVPPTDAPVERLIERLGSDKFCEREAAGKEIQEIGLPALQSLYKAAQNGDVDIRRRADELIRAIERKATTETALQPTRVTLRYENTPLRAAVADLCKQTRFDRIELKGDGKKLDERKVTLQTKELPFWEALDRFCEAAEVTHPFRSAAQANTRFEVNNMNDASKFSVIPPIGWSPPSDSRTITLVDGKPPRVPTYYAGAVRIRVMPGDVVKAAREDKTEANLRWEIFPEPKIHWHGVSGLLLDQAVDDLNQHLSRPASDGLPLSDDEANADVRAALIMQAQQQAVLRRGAVIRQGNLWAIEDFPVGGRPNGGSQQGSLRLQLPEKSGKSVKELKAHLIARVEPRMQPIVTIDDILNAEKKIYEGKDGSRLQLMNITPYNNGELSILVKIYPPRNALPTSVTGQLSLIDTEGKVFKITPKGQTPPIVENDVVYYQIRNSYIANRYQKKAHQLVYSTSWPVAVEVPVVLKDIPLSSGG